MPTPYEPRARAEALEAIFESQDQAEAAFGAASEALDYQFAREMRLVEINFYQAQLIRAQMDILRLTL